MNNTTEKVRSEPIPEEDEPIISSTNNVNQLSSDDVASAERKANLADRMEKHVYKKHGLNLMIGCIIGYGAVIVLDTIISAFGWQISSLTQGFVELLKFLISTLIGFVFSENLKKDK